MLTGILLLIIAGYCFHYAMSMPKENRGVFDLKPDNIHTEYKEDKFF